MQILCVHKIDFSKYTYLFVSTTAKHASSTLRLPDRHMSGGTALNFIITDPVKAIELFHKVDGVISNVIIDIELKQNIDLYSIAQQCIKKSNLFTYKPNDLTLESTITLLDHHFTKELAGKKILIIGTGNISFKLALRLAESNVQLYIDGRNKEKVSQIVGTINMVLPAFSKYKVREFDINGFENAFDAIIPFISAEKIIPESYAALLKESSISVDGGIGNFSEQYIALALKKKSKVIRLDVRIALPYTEASLMMHSSKYHFFNEVCGESVIDNIHIVAGGIIGQEGTVIVDQIKKPQQIIGIANGFGGVKHESTISAEERRSIELLRKQIQ